MSVPMTSINAYYDLKEEGKISERQELAFMTVRKFYEEYSYWPTAKEVHVFLAIEQDNKMAQIEGPNFIKPRITELIKDPDDEYPDLLEKKDMTREQAYIERQVDEYDSTRKAKPVKIVEDMLDREDTEDSEASESGEESDLEDDVNQEEEGEDGDSVIVSSDSSGSEKDAKDDEDTEEQEEENSFDSGDVIFGGEDSDEDSSEEADEDSEDDYAVTSMTDENGDRYERNEDGNWEDEEGNEYILHPENGFKDASEQKDENGSEDLDENQGKVDGEKDEKQLSLNSS